MKLRDLIKLINDDINIKLVFSNEPDTTLLLREGAMDFTSLPLAGQLKRYNYYESYTISGITYDKNDKAFEITLIEGSQDQFKKGDRVLVYGRVEANVTIQLDTLTLVAFDDGSTNLVQTSEIEKVMAHE